MSGLRVVRIGERAAFHGSPLDGVPPIRALLRQGPDPRLTWMLGVCLGAAGRYGAAIDVLLPLTSPDRLSSPPVASLASSTLGSLHRQLGVHDQARGFDLQALDLVRDGAPAAGPDEPELWEPALIDARLGLAADAVGLRDLALAGTELTTALNALDAARTARTSTGKGAGAGAGRGRVVAAPDGWRVRARSGWVRAEVALLSGDPAPALVAARESIRLARAAQAPRHEAKGLLFAAVAQSCLGRPDEAGDVAMSAMRLSVRLGAWPLVWPAALVLGDLLPAGTRRDRVLDLGAFAVGLISAGLPPELAEAWRGGADVQRLLQRASVPG